MSDNLPILTLSKTFANHMKTSESNYKWWPCVAYLLYVFLGTEELSVSSQSSLEFKIRIALGNSTGLNIFCINVVMSQIKIFKLK